jgi:ATP-dependent 26S proteasome regulatory subunit
MKSALDTAFMRRLRFIVNFPFPGPGERKMIWEKVFPQQAPKEELDYERLGRFNMTGGNIHSIALNAAFIAAQTNSKVTMPIVLSAMRTEYRKLEKVSEAEFRLRKEPGPNIPCTLNG